MAISAAFLVGLGFEPFQAALLCLIANTAPVAWGAIGTPILTLSTVTGLDGDRLVTREEPALPSLNERLRDDYIADCQRGVDRWNRVIKEHGIDFQLRLPHRAFQRAIGLFADVRVSPEGRVLSQAEWEAKKHEWLPTEEDQAWVESLMRPETEPGKFASWIAPPPRGVNGQPLDFEYVRLA